jgi:membrane-bound lytic murein transglycosylase
METYNNREKGIDSETAMKDATAKINAEYAGKIENDMAQMDASAARRGFYGQLPTEALKNARASDINIAKERDIRTEADRAVQQSQDRADKENALKMNVVTQALQMAQSGDQAKQAQAMQMLNYMAGRGDTAFNQGIQNKQVALQEANVTGVMEDGTKTLQAQRYDKADEQWNKEYEMKLDVTKQQLAKGEIDIATAKEQLKRLQDPNSPENQVRMMELKVKQLELENLPKEQALKLKQIQASIDDAYNTIKNRNASTEASVEN